jgi:hypothetical protein
MPSSVRKPSFVLFSPNGNKLCMEVVSLSVPSFFNGETSWNSNIDSWVEPAAELEVIESSMESPVHVGEGAP